MPTKEREHALKATMSRCISVHGEKICNRLYHLAINESLTQAEVIRALRLTKWTVRYWVQRIKNIVG